MMGPAWKVRSLLRLSAVCWLASVSGPVTADDVWIDIDTDSRSLTVMDEDNALRPCQDSDIAAAAFQIGYIRRNRVRCNFH